MNQKGDIYEPEVSSFLKDKKVIKIVTRGFFYGITGIDLSLSSHLLIDVACGMFHTLALTDEGHVYGFGQLGLGTTIDQDTPNFFLQ